jgi:hypothetical protein
MTDRVRALLITPDGDLLTIRRVRPGQDPYALARFLLSHLREGTDLFDLPDLRASRPART